MDPLAGLADIVTPPPVSWLPQTWGWAVLGAVLLVLLAWMLWRWRKRREANRYRREALSELSEIPVAEIPALLKRTALAAWPRDKVAALSGEQWVAFLQVSGPLADLLNDAEYRSTSVSSEEAKTEAKHWIENHHKPIMGLNMTFER